MKLTNTSFFSLLVICHLLFVIGIFYFELIHYIILFIMSVLQILISTTLYHRYYSHNSWKCPNWYKFIGTFIGTFGLTGSPLFRTISHLNHHAFSDTQNDSHCPYHYGIIKTYFPQLIKREKKINFLYGKKIMNDKFALFMSKYYLHILIVVYLMSFITFGFVFTVAILIGPGVMCWLNISICNIFCHSHKLSNTMIKNNHFIALITMGEGYHLTHHNYPNEIRFGKFDMGYFFINVILLTNELFKKIKLHLFFYNSYKK